MMDCGFPSDANFPHRTNNRPLYEDSTAAIAECRDGLDLVHTLLVGGFAVAAMVAVFGGGV